MFRKAEGQSLIRCFKCLLEVLHKALSPGTTYLLGYESLGVIEFKGISTFKKVIKYLHLNDNQGLFPQTQLI